MENKNLTEAIEILSDENVQEAIAGAIVDRLVGRGGPGGTGQALTSTPDLLALQARVQQLEAALRGCLANDNSSYVHHQPRQSDGALPKSQGGTIWKTPTELAKGVLNAPPLPVSPLWELIHSWLKWWDLCDDLSGPDIYREMEFWRKKAWAARESITPELRALIAEMAKGGRE